MNRKIFAVGISAIHVTGNLVRIDLLPLQLQLKSDNKKSIYDKAAI